MAMDKYQKMMSRYLKEMDPDVFKETDDPDVFKAVLSDFKIQGFQRYLDRMKAEDEKKGMLTEKGSPGELDSSDQKLIALAKKQTKKVPEGSHVMPDGSIMKDEDHKEEVSKDVAKDLANEGRGLKGYKAPKTQEKRGYKQDEGGNWSVNEKDKHWQTKKGYDEAIKLYGTKPGWVKQPSLVYNPKTKEYDPIKKEEYVDLKPTKRISL